MANTFFVDIVQSLDDFPQKPHSFFHGQSPYFIHVVEEGSSVEILKHQADIILFFKESIEFDDVGMI